MQVPLHRLATFVNPHLEQLHPYPFEKLRLLLAGLLASVEHGLNRVLRLDSTALARLGQVLR